MKQRALTPRDVQQLKPYGIDQIQNINSYCVEYEALEYLCREECPITNLLFICTGSAKVFHNLENGKRLLSCFYQAGSVIGDLEFLTERKMAVCSVQAITTCTCVVIPIAQNRSLLYQNPRFLRTIGNVLAGKFERSVKNNAHIILYPLEVRLCSYIDTGCKTDCFKEKLTEVAEVLGTSYRHLIRALNSLIADGILRKEGHAYYIINRQELNYRSKDFYKPIEGDLNYDPYSEIGE